MDTSHKGSQLDASFLNTVYFTEMQKPTNNNKTTENGCHFILFQKCLESVILVPASTGALVSACFQVWVSRFFILWVPMIFPIHHLCLSYPESISTKGLYLIMVLLSNWEREIVTGIILSPRLFRWLPAWTSSSSKRLPPLPSPCTRQSTGSHSRFFSLPPPASSCQHIWLHIEALPLSPSSWPLLQFYRTFPHSSPWTCTC